MPRQSVVIAKYVSVYNSMQTHPNVTAIVAKRVEAPGSLGELMGKQWMELQQWIFPQSRMSDLDRRRRITWREDLVQSIFGATVVVASLGAITRGESVLTISVDVSQSVVQTALGRLPLPNSVGQVGRPLCRFCADYFQRHTTRVHALEQANSGAKQHR
jgi:hypothetical protein